NQYAIDMIVIDHYGINYEYEKELKEKTGIKVFVLDDTYERHYCDVLLNHNIYADEKKYKNLVPESCELRCGTKYTLLRDEFLQVETKRIHNNTLLNVLITMGGADSANLNVKILKVLESFPDCIVNVVTTTANQFLNELHEYVTDKKNIKLHVNTDQIANLMSEAHFAIVTPSVTLNEIVYMKLPFIAIQTALNQNNMVEYLHQKNAMVLHEFNVKQLKLLVEELIAKYYTSLINFIHLSEYEKEMILNWRNDNTVSKWMLTQDKISLDEHLAYIDSLSSREDRLYFLVKKQDEAIGIIDFTDIDFTNSKVECGLYAKPNLKGVGGVLMSRIIDYAFNVLNMKTLIAEVFDNNKAAIKLYQKYRFREMRKDTLGTRVIMHMELTNENR
ncbi:MAG TPA: UDP-2,4-diacetamido-2,4,6-trideoxy-beta-L-altropyranose hydrolase, partial [Arcobacter sp.]|nr:UDP-2,4-diacetamido-2,4,6-trideoxy-beta-L-altropyranose hydrolase [Arcobacter sp.]